MIEFVEKYRTTGVELNPNHVNKNITFHVLDDDSMRKLGFVKRVRGDMQKWSFSKSVGKSEDDGIAIFISFPCDESKQDGLRIDVIDDDFGQPYDFQMMIRKDPSFEYANCVAENVEDILDMLTFQGVIIGHARYDYI